MKKTITTILSIFMLLGSMITISAQDTPIKISELNVGDKVLLGNTGDDLYNHGNTGDKISWIIVDMDNYKDLEGNDLVTMISECVLTSKEYKKDSTSFGSNNYANSDMRNYLISSEFLSHFNEKELSVLMDANYTYAEPESYSSYDEKEMSGDKFYLPSYIEIGGDPINDSSSSYYSQEGKKLDYFSSNETRKVENLENDFWSINGSWATRSIMKMSSSGVVLVSNYQNGKIVSGASYNGGGGGSPITYAKFGVRPLCNIDKDTLVIKSDYADDEDNQYYELYTPTISIDSNISMTIGDSIILNADTSLEGAEVKWQISSSDGTITLEENGISANITANKIGEVTVTVSLVDYPDIKAECIISITDRQIDEPSKPSNPSRPSSPSKDLPSNTEECQKEFGKDYIYSKDLDACIIKYLVVDTSTK